MVGYKRQGHEKVRCVELEVAGAFRPARAASVLRFRADSHPCTNLKKVLLCGAQERDMQAMLRTSTNIEPCQCQPRSCETERTRQECQIFTKKQNVLGLSPTTNLNLENPPRGKTPADNLHASTRQSSAKCREHARIPNTKHRAARKSVFRCATYR
jgi:hypothetical protein